MVQNKEEAHEMTAFTRSHDSDFEKKIPKNSIARNIKTKLKKGADSYVRFIVRPPKVITFGQSTEAVGKNLIQHDGDGTYEKSFNYWPPPLAIFIISLIQVACFIAEEYAIPKSSPLIITKYLAYDPCKREEVWRLLSYMFVHAGWVHLIGNVGVQLLLGIALECVNKSWKVLYVYFVGGIAGALLSSVVEPNVCVVGASGGLYALLTAYISSIFLNWKSKIKPIVELIAAMVFISGDLSYTLIKRATNDFADTVSYSAHLAGAIIGVLLGLWLLKIIKPMNNTDTQTNNKTVKYLRWTSFILAMVLIGIPIVLNIFWTAHFCKAITKQ